MPIITSWVICGLLKDINKKNRANEISKKKSENNPYTHA